MNTSFQSLNQLSAEISKNIELLSQGQLSNEQLVKLTDSTRELHERMVVIRHKMFEKFGETEAEPEIESKVVEAETNQKEENTIFDFTEPEEKNEPVEEMMSFDFSEPIQAEKIEPITENVVERVEVKQMETSTSLNESIKSNDHSLNDVFKNAGSNSLADKLNQSAIADLKAHIDINKKFKFINELFNGSNENYNQAIDALNNCSDADDARQKLSEMSQNQNWDVESEAVSTFVQLVERRYV